MQFHAHELGSAPMWQSTLVRPLQGHVWSRACAAAVVFGCIFGLSGCGGPSDPATRDDRVLAPLLDLTPIPASSDTFAAHRPEEISCNNVGGWYLEENSLEVDTGECNYLSLTEPAATSLPAGTRIETELSYFDLTADAPSEAHVALVIAGEVIWEEMIPIPSDARVIELALELPRAVEVGDPVEFHLHNHGQNTWNFTPIVAR